MSNIKPLGNRVLVRQHSEKQVTESGFLLPDSAQHEFRGSVIAHGPDATGLKVGDEILYKLGAAWRIEQDGDLYLIQEDAVLGVAA